MKKRGGLPFFYENQTEKVTSRKKKFYFLVGILSTVLILLGITSFLISRKTNTGTNISNSPHFILNTGYIRDFLAKKAEPRTLPDLHPSAEDTIDTLRLPKTNFKNWTGFTSINTPKTSSVYQLKENYALEEVKSLARKLSAFDVVKDYKNHVMSYTLGKKGQAASLLLFNKNTGEFAYSATSGIILPDEKDTISERLYSFLKTLNWYDPSLIVSAHYKKQSDPELTYYEIRRDWNAVGLPILNPIGLLNLDESETIAKLQANAKTIDLQENPEIYQTSDNKDGFERKNDFNTMTIAVSDLDDSVVIIKSNIRPLEKGITTQADIISYEEAVNKLKTNTNSFILTTPAGLGNVIAWEKIYPNQIAEAKTATITESSIAYLENSPSAQQKTLEPYYIFRGNAQLTSEYRVNFIAAVSAVSKSQAAISNPFSFSFIPQAYAQAATQKQKTFELIVTPRPTATPLPAFSTCVPAADQLNPRYEQNASDPNLRSRVSFGWSPVAVIKGEIRLSRKGWWYYVPGDDTTSTNLRDDINQVFIQIRSITNRRDFRKFNDGTPPNILEDYRATGNACPIRVTGDSPTIFIYAPAGTNLDIQPVAQTYADPKLKNSRWHIKIAADKTLSVNNSQRNYLYYEYIDVSFDHPKQGWNIQKNEIHSLANTIGTTLHLTDRESERLVFELTHASEEVSSNSIFVGIIPQNEVDKKLPLSINPVPETFKRYFFYVGKRSATLEAPILESIQRSKYTVIELGSFSEK